jgi:hypothetical protein
MRWHGRGWISGHCPVLVSVPLTCSNSWASKDGQSSSGIPVQPSCRKLSKVWTMVLSCYTALIYNRIFQSPFIGNAYIRPLNEDRSPIDSSWVYQTGQWTMIQHWLSGMPIERVFSYLPWECKKMICHSILPNVWRCIEMTEWLRHQVKV